VQFFLGTANRTKVRQLAAAAHPYGVEIPSAVALPEVVEDADTAEENARLKAAAYADVLRAPVLSMDASLLLAELSLDEQPGVRVRRIPGMAGRPTDEELLAHYTALCISHGGRLRARWTFGFAVGLPDGTLLSTTATVERAMVAPPCPQRRAGNPLDSLQVEPKAGRRLAQLGEGEIQVLWRDLFGATVQQLLRRA
jgi:inosine/xanthosine triphosphate pyrophosphatase family protein